MRNVIDDARSCPSEGCLADRRTRCVAGRSCPARSYAELDDQVRGLLARMRGEPDLAVRTLLLTALAHAERRLAVLHPCVFPPDPTTSEQAESMSASALLVEAVTIASRGALGERVALPFWTGAPWSPGVPALLALATTTDPGARGRALEELVSILRPHLGTTATECVAELAAVEHHHAAAGATPRPPCF
ncbi:hypothetical protein LQ327_00560 [Actinomycetospora endophytica]|uniref:Uncharacterized protein n=1 Tax=Actinomycetospora endophytica TaxID=2291215 RepID=A0ABS8P0V5_9PSEU|nr:hypothetical protein [Actinomycetospora endophytica]MCD2191880.1 hypothetical protein [Actinomycetospora endophytica]